MTGDQADRVMNDWHDGWGAGTWITMILVMVAFWGLLAALIVYAIRSGDERRTAAARPEDEAQRILDERFARGDIDADEYKGRRELLQGR